MTEKEEKVEVGKENELHSIEMSEERRKAEV